MSDSPTLRKRWLVLPPLTSEAEAALSAYPQILRRLLYNRGIHSQAEAEAYLEARPPEGAEPQNMLGIPEAVERICYAIQHDEKIVVYGDYDVDGVTATSLLKQALEALGANVDGYIPNRFEEGYGVNKDALQTLHEEGARLVVTVDCGIRSLAEAEFARQIGLDLIITDHHHPGAELPPALAIVNPKQPGDSYPEKNLAGVGLAFKLASALFAHPQLAPRLAAGAGIDEYLDLVALGTVADLAPLTGENRALVKAGLEYIRHPRRQGLVSLLGVASLLDMPDQRRNGGAGFGPPTASKVTATDIAFILGPRLNAAGRLDSALAALELLTEKDVHKTGMLSQQLNAQNRERQEITREIQKHAEELALGEDPEAFLLFAVAPHYNEGVIGLAASRLTEAYYRPAIVASQGEEFTRASCRSIPEFHITEALDTCADLLERHGGHAAAAGFTVRNDRLAELAERLRAQAAEKLADQDLRPKLKADMEIDLQSLPRQEIPEILEMLDKLQPTGFGNVQATFVSRQLAVRRYRTVGRDDSHLKLTLSPGGNGFDYDAIAFRQGYWAARWAEQRPDTIDVLYTFDINEYNGRRSLQLKVRDLKPSDEED